MLMMPDLKEIIKEKQELINNQRFQIEKLQKEVYKMYLRIKGFNARLVEEQKQ